MKPVLWKAAGSENNWHCYLSSPCCRPSRFMCHSCPDTRQPGPTEDSDHYLPDGGLCSELIMTPEKASGSSSARSNQTSYWNWTWPVRPPPTPPPSPLLSESWRLPLQALRAALQQIRKKMNKRHMTASHWSGPSREGAHSKWTPPWDWV